MEDADIEVWYLDYLKDSWLLVCGAESSTAGAVICR
jgi:hypothetical protein